MSNKIQLQANNDELDALIARVNAAKNTAASLPEAESGGGGGTSVETCTITILDIPDPGTIMYYIDGSMVFCEAEIGKNQSYTVVKNSLLVVAGFIAPIGGATQKATFGINAIYQATG